MELAEKALELVSTSADVRVLIGHFKAGVQWDWAAAEEAYCEAIRINPNCADAHFFLGDLLLSLGHQEEWEGEMRRALDLDPLNDFTACFYGWHLNYVGRYDEAVPIFLKLREMGPDRASNHLGLWGAYFKKRMYSESAASARDYFREIGDAEVADAVGTPEDEASYRAAMRRTGELMARRSEEHHVPAIRIARMFAHAGDNDAAVSWLEVAYKARESPLQRLAFSGIGMECGQIPASGISFDGLGWWIETPDRLGEIFPRPAVVRVLLGQQAGSQVLRMILVMMVAFPRFLRDLTDRPLEKSPSADPRGGGHIHIALPVAPVA